MNDLSSVMARLGEELGMQTNFTVVLLTMALLLSRILPVILLSPFLGGDLTPTEVKLGVALSLGLILFPGVVDRTQYIPVSALPFLLLLLKELFIGLALSMVVGAVFHAANVAGTLIDTMAGTTMAQVMVPQMQQQVTIFASFKLQLAVVLFLTLNGHLVVFDAFADSLLFIPLDQFPAFSKGAWAFFELILRVFGELMKVGLALAAPVMVAAFLTDLSLGIVNRVAPQIQVYAISMQIKPMVTVLLVLVTLHVVVDRLAQESAAMLRLLRQAILLLG